jgi:hypothetical protein
MAAPLIDYSKKKKKIYNSVLSSEGVKTNEMCGRMTVWCGDKYMSQKKVCDWPEICRGSLASVAAHSELPAIVTC